jgi:predicted glycoside hydrolase/deacetylase ChbG (UPF0249 family)
VAAVTSSKYIAVCVDDFGLHLGINEAVFQLARLGRINAVSCMTGAPKWRAGAERLAVLPQDRIDVGLHLDLTEYPLHANLRTALPALLLRSHARRLDSTSIREEIHAQLDLFEQGLGRAPAYVDGHEHVHQFPVIREALLAVLLERYPQRRPWLRATRRPAFGGLAGFKPWVIEHTGCARLTALARANGYPQNRGLLGVYDFKGDAERYLGLLAQWLHAARHGDLLMCHPGLRTAGPVAHLQARCNEYEVLSGPAFPLLLEQSGIGLAALSRLPPLE